MHFFAQRRLFYLNFVKARTEYPTYLGDGDEGIWVNLMNQTEDQRTLRLAHEHRDDLHRFLGVPAGAIENRHAAVDSGIDGGSYLVVFGRIDKEMDGAMQPGHDLVHGECIRDGHRHTVEDAFDMQVCRIRSLFQHTLR